MATPLSPRLDILRSFAQTQSTMSLPNGTVTKRYCCGCNSRTSSIIASSFLLAGGLLYSAGCIAALADTSAGAPTDDERIIFQVLLPCMLMQTSFSALSIWGACTYRGWPVKVLLGWVTIGMIFSCIGMIVTANPVVLVGLLLQTFLIWMPLYGYGRDHRQLAVEAGATNTPGYELPDMGEPVVEAELVKDESYSDKAHDDLDKDDDDMEVV